MRAPAAAIVSLAVIGLVTACASSNPSVVITSPTPTLASPSATIFHASPIVPTPLGQNVPKDPNLPPYEFNTGTSGSYPPTYAASSSGGPNAPALSCRLPMYAGGQGSGGFMVFPDGNFVADPRSAVNVPGATGPTYFGLSYDHAVAQWLPVPREWVTPDGKRYAFPNPGGDGVNVVDVATNAVTHVGSGHRWNVLDVEAQGAYVTDQTGGPGLWLLPFSGAAVQISPAGYWQAVGGGAAYGMSTSAVPNGVANEIDRLDLKTGNVQPWFKVDDAMSSVMGFDANGNALMNVRSLDLYFNNTEIWVVYGQGKAEALAMNANFGAPLADSHGIWLSDNYGLFLLVPTKGMYLASSINGQIAGDCA